MTAPLTQSAPSTPAGVYAVDPESPNDVVLRDSRGRLLETIEVRLFYPLGVARKPGEVCETEKRTAEKIAAALNGDYRGLLAVTLRERATLHRLEAQAIECSAGYLSREQISQAAWLRGQARALHHEAELIEKGPQG